MFDRAANAVVSLICQEYIQFSSQTKETVLMFSHTQALTLWLVTSFNFRCSAGFNVLSLTPKSKQESPPDTRVKRDSTVIPRWPSAAILDIIEPEIVPFDLLTPKNPCLEPDMEWIGCTVSEIFAFKLYCDLEIGVCGHSRSLKAAPLDQPTPKT